MRTKHRRVAAASGRVACIPSQFVARLTHRRNQRHHTCPASPNGEHDLGDENAKNHSRRAGCSDHWRHRRGRADRQRPAGAPAGDAGRLAGAHPPHMDGLDARRAATAGRCAKAGRRRGPSRWSIAQEDRKLAPPDVQKIAEALPAVERQSYLEGGGGGAGAGRIDRLRPRHAGRLGDRPFHDGPAQRPGDPRRLIGVERRA